MARLWKNYIATACGHAIKFVFCERCGTEYVYMLDREGIGVGTSLLSLDNWGAENRSVLDAERSLTRELLLGCDVVPCPQCGWVQKRMIPLAQSIHHRWMLKLGSMLLYGAAMSALPVFIFADHYARFPALMIGLWSFVGIIALCGTVLLFVRHSLCNRYDPNSEPSADLMLVGQRIAITKQEFDNAVEWLQQLLASGPTEEATVKKNAAELAITRRTLAWAKDHLNVIARRDGSGKASKMVWQLPVEETSMFDPT